MSVDWAMFWVTLIYVIATIFICIANIGATKSAREQTDEMKRQFSLMNRPIIEHELIYEKRSFYGVRFVNHGAETAYHVKVTLDEQFIESLNEQSFKDLLRKQIGRECIIGVGQHYDLFFGTNKLRGNEQLCALSGTVTYSGKGKEYSEHLYIDLPQYMTIFSVNTEHDDMIDKIKKQTEELCKIRQQLERIRLLDEDKNDA